MRIPFVIILLFFSLLLQCQTWERTFSTNTDVLPYELIETYDDGYLLNAGIAIGNLLKIGWIIKLDVNGTISGKAKIIKVN